MKKKFEYRHYTDWRDWTFGVEVFSIKGDLYGEIYYVRDKDVITFNFGPLKMVLWIWHLDGNEKYAYPEKKYA